jgi:hypothetical protein
MEVYSIKLKEVPWVFLIVVKGISNCRLTDGRSWFTVRSWNPYYCGRAWELMEGFKALKKEGKNARYSRSTAIVRSNFETQKARGKWWAEEVAKIAKDKSPDGTYYLVGAEWWKYMDNGWTYWVEQVNWGLVSLKDNAYDGKEATKLGADGKAGTWDDEVNDYGDALSSVTKANKLVYRDILTNK